MMTSAARQPVLEEEHDHRDVDHQAISQRVGVLPELRFDPQPPRQPAVHLIGDRGGSKTMAAGQLCPSSPLASSTTKTGTSTNRAIVSAFGSCAIGAGTARAPMGQG